MEPQAMPTSDVVIVRVQDHLATITIDNPPVNTITKALRAGLARALDQIEHATGVRGVLLHCAGSTFCSGADIAEFDGPPLEAEYRTLFARLEALPVPVVVALHGTVLGGGLELALCGHYRVAHPRTRMGFPEVTLGIFPGATGTQRMPRLIGAERTLEIELWPKEVQGLKRSAAVLQETLGQVLSGATG